MSLGAEVEKWSPGSRCREEISLATLQAATFKGTLKNTEEYLLGLGGEEGKRLKHSEHNGFAFGQQDGKHKEITRNPLPNSRWHPTQSEGWGVSADQHCFDLNRSKFHLVTSIKKCKILQYYSLNKEI